MLIGDSSCAIEPFLLRKLQETQTPADNLYNESILQTRNVVEDSMGCANDDFQFFRWECGLNSSQFVNTLGFLCF
jgi:hypothetical protein